MRTSILAFILSASIAISCQKDALSSVCQMDEIIFMTEGDGISTEVQTKVSEVVSLSSFYVNCVTGTAGSGETSRFNVSFSGTSTYSGGKFWPVSDLQYKFYASNVAMTPSSDGPTIVAKNTTDVVCATCLSPAFKSCNLLSFNHIFARLGKTVVSVQSGYELSNVSLKITPKTGGTYNIFDGMGQTDGTGWTATTSGSAVTIASALGDNAATDVYLVPGTYTVTATYTLTKGDYVITKTGSTQDVSLVGGKINMIRATLSGASAEDITFTVTVAPWGSATHDVTLS